ncbi:MAG: putative lipid II flippase FtsW [Kiritimatiellaeota bacterium]|nr:putative lipid II flippase FtsW [Kiritimatiellota bacterium]
MLLLSVLGIVMLASTSAAQGELLHQDAAYFLKRQAVWLLAALFVGALASRVNYHVWRPLAIPLMLACVALLLAVWLPHVGRGLTKGSHRWLHLGPLNFQPSELAKFGVICWLAWWMTRVRRRAEDVKLGLLVPLAGLGLVLGLVFFEPDFGTTMLLGVVGLAMMYLGGARFGHLALASVAGLVFMALAIAHDANRMNRFLAFINPEKHAKGFAFQLTQSLHAFVMGGAGGVGFGQSLQKQFYLPEAHTDFIFAILGEELGLPAALGVLLLFFGLCVCGMRIAFRAADQFGRLLAFGITLLITLQAAINIGVVTGCLPTKGLALPFISFGGSSLVVTFAMVGVLANIARQTEADPRRDETRCIHDQAHDL